MKKKILLLFIFFSHIVAIEKKLFVVIPSYNNDKWAEKNLLSVITQKYDNFEGIYVDDCSLDQTGTIVQNILQKYDSSGKIEYVKNTEHRGKTANLWFTLHGLNAKKKINDDDIIVILDGDDWYAHDQVFSYLNDLYTTHDIWFTYGGFFRHPPQFDKLLVDVPCDVVEKNLFRSFKGCGSQQRTFYAWLYRRIKLSDFFFAGKFMPCAGDMAKVIPIMEMAGPRFKRIDEKIYVYNRSNVLNDDKICRLQGTIDKYIRQQLSKYSPLIGREPRVMSDEKIDVICLIDTHIPDQLGCFIETLKKSVQNINNIRIIDVSLNAQQTFKERLLQECALSSDYVCIINTFDVLDIPQVDLMVVKQVLWKAQGLMCFLKLKDKTIIKFEKLTNDIGVVQHGSTNNFATNCTFDFQVFETATLKNLLAKINFIDISSLISLFRQLSEVNNPYSISLFLKREA